MLFGENHFFFLESFSDTNIAINGWNIILDKFSKLISTRFLVLFFGN